MLMYRCSLHVLQVTQPPRAPGTEPDRCLAGKVTCTPKSSVGVSSFNTDMRPTTVPGRFPASPCDS